jgi:hypothetical protein
MKTFIQSNPLTSEDFPVMEKGRAVIIGNGPSLKNITLWDSFKNALFVGCNDAFQLPICDVCVWGDTRWWTAWKDKESFKNFKGKKVTNNKLQRNEADIIYIPRLVEKVTNDSLCWFGNTGITAIHLAALYGATEICLIGFDMGMVDGQAHWHDHPLIPPSEEVYPKFISQFSRFKTSFELVYPQVKIFNCTENSNLKIYPFKPLKYLMKVR